MALDEDLSTLETVYPTPELLLPERIQVEYQRLYVVAQKLSLELLHPFPINPQSSNSPEAKEFSKFLRFPSI